MNKIIAQIILQIVLIFLNAVFACAEIAVLSMNDNKLEKLAESGDKRARRLSKLTCQPARFLATIQVAITLSGFLGSAFAADNFSDPIVSALKNAGVPIGIETLNTIAVVVITIILSFITLVFGELVPKRLAMRKAEMLALGLSGTVRFISIVFAPLVWLLTASTNMILRMLGIDPNAEDSEVSEEDIRMMAEVGTENGVLDEQENNIIQNVFEFDDISVGEIMTHRTEVIALRKEDSVEEWNKTIFDSNHMYYPVYDKNADQIIGVLDARKYFRLKSLSKETIFENAVNKPFFVSSQTKADELFRMMKESKMRFAVVVDEFGGTDGIITLSDLIEQLIGELESSADEIIKIDDSTYKILGSTELYKVERELKCDFESDAATLNGWIVEKLGTIPPIGESFEHEKFEFEIVSTDEKLVREVVVKKIPDTDNQ